MKKYLLKYYLFFKYLPFCLFGKKPSILTFDQTIEEIVTKKKSFCRFGDGEIRMMLDSGEIGFQKRNAELTAKLKEVILSDNPNLLLGLPNTFGSVSKQEIDSQIFWLGFNTIYAKKFIFQLDLSKVYGDATITRFYMAYKNKDRLFVQRKIDRLKSIWQDKDILIIEGSKTRLGVGNDLFINTSSIKRIVCPPKDAFDHYEDIIQAAKKFGNNRLIMIALGPTASILAADLSKLNYWAIDIGHIDIEYSWFLQNKSKKDVVKGKDVNEAQVHMVVDNFEFDDSSYEAAILKKIG